MSFEISTLSQTKPDDPTEQPSATPLRSVPPAEMSSTHTAPTSPADATIITSSVSAPDVIIATKPLAAASMVFSPSVDFTILQASRTSSTDALSSIGSGIAEGSSGTASPAEPDMQILEALRSKDRLWVLKLGESMETLINERKQPRIELNPATSYQRMLVHKCAAYHRLTSESDNSRSIYVSLRPDSTIPARRICELVPAEESAQPAFKIMRRSPQDRRVRQTSQPDSVAGEDGDVSDSAEPSEAGSSAGRSNTTGSGKKHMTIEERAAAYNEARSRIFMDFEDKDKDASTNSSSTNLASGSGSAGRSSTGEPEDSSSAATESEWSGPVTRDKRESRRGGSTHSSSRSHRSYNHASGSNSSRHSRAASPSSFPTLYDPQAGTFDPAFGQQGSSHGYVQYYYGYPPTAPGAPPPFMPHYGYSYPPYAYPPHPPSHPHSDPVTPGEPIYPNVQSPANGPYPPNPYSWPPPHPGQPATQSSNITSPAASTASLPAGIPQQNPISPTVQPMPPQSTMGYPSYFPQYPHYPMPGYYPPAYAVPPGQMPPPAPPLTQGQYYPETTYGHEYQGNGQEVGPDSLDRSRASSQNSSHGSVNGRRTGPSARRQPWSYGPGIGMGGPSNGDFVGPRLNNRRQSSGSAGYRTPGDEASSVTSSSTTSSSSQRTFTSTSSKHPLPARPDWAVGLKAQPTLSAHSRTMSPARMGGNLPHHQRSHQPPPSLQGTDFPPLSSGSGPEKKVPAVGGAWTNASSVRSALRAGPPGTTSAPQVGNALVHHHNANGGNQGPSPSAGRLDEQDDAFERPPAKGNAELFNPRGLRSRAASSVSVGEEGNKEITPDVLAYRIGGLTLALDGDMPLTSSPTPATPPSEAQ